MSEELLSIIVPVYNVQNYLIKCVESVLNQKYPNIEIILVDDGSTDKSGVMCDQLAKEHNDRIKVIHKKNGGLSSARNAGIEIASGAYIGFVDSDDYVDLNMYSTLYKLIKTKNADIAICNCYLTFEDGRKITRFDCDENEIVMDSEKAIMEMNSFRFFDMAAWNKLYKTDLFRDIRFPEGKLSEDYYIMYKLFDLADKIIYTGIPLYIYMQRKGSISKTPKINLDFVEAAKRQMEYVEIKYPNLKSLMHAAYASSCMTVYNILILHGGKCTKSEILYLKRIVRNNLQYINMISTWSMEKKIQAYLFTVSLPMYNVAYRKYKKSRGLQS